MTVHFASHSGSTPIKVLRKPGIIFPVIRNPDGRWSKFKSPVPVDCCVCPVAVPTLTVWAERSMLTMGASAAKYMSVAPESTMPVVVIFGLLGKGLSKVGLKLTL